jgi:hypothetical protein
MKAKLPIIRLRMLPDLRCTRCGQRGYVNDKDFLCASCLNISLCRFAKVRRAELEARKA